MENMDKFLLFFLAFTTIGYSGYLAFFARMGFRLPDLKGSGPGFWLLFGIILPTFSVIVVLPQVALILVSEDSGRLTQVLEEHGFLVLFIGVIAHGIWWIVTAELVRKFVRKPRSEAVKATGFALLMYICLQVSQVIVHVIS